VPAGQTLREDDYGGQIPRSKAASDPFPLTSTSIAVSVATGRQDDSHLRRCSKPAFFVDKLVSMGKRIILCDPHRVVVLGLPLYGERLEA
jgi:UDP-N-acetylglucosamine 1-carboxyvinyltransferase